MKFYKAAVRSFMAYQLYYTLQFFKYSETLYTTKGFLLDPLFNMSTDQNLIFVKIFFILKMIVGLFAFFMPLSFTPWLITLCFHLLVIYYSPNFVSIAFPFITFQILSVLCANQAIQYKNAAVLEKTASFGYFGLTLAHFTAGLTKAKYLDSLWLNGSAFKEIMTYTVWKRDWYQPLLHYVPGFAFAAMNYFTLTAEIMAVFMFWRRGKILMCLVLLGMHIGALFIFSLEEISLACAVCLVVLLAMFRLVKLYEEKIE